MTERLRNFVNGAWRAPNTLEMLEVLNPASAQVLAEVRLSPAAEVALAVESASKAFGEWRRRPAGERIQPLFKLKALLEENLDALARTITEECGKTYAESIGEMRRAIENVETACGIPSFESQARIEGLIAKGQQAGHGVEFYTQTKVIVERWPRDWSRRL